MGYTSQTSGIIDHAFIKNMYNGMQGYGVVTGMTPSVTGSSMVVSIAAGSVRTASGPIAYAGGSVTLSNGDATNPRTDLIIWDDSADTIAKLEGTPTAESATQSKPPASDLADPNDLVLAMVYVGDGTTTIPSNQLFDRRIIVPGSSTTSTVVKANDESVQSSTTLQNDNELSIAVAANTTYIIQAAFHATGSTAGDIKIAFTGPSGASIVVNFFGYNTSADPTFTTITTLGDPFSGNISPSMTAIHCTGLLEVGATAGNLAVQWAQNSSNSTATVMEAGSWMTVRAAT